MIDFDFEFRYAEEKEPVLRQVSGSIPQGRCVVLYGGVWMRHFAYFIWNT